MSGPAKLPNWPFLARRLRDAGLTLSPSGKRLAAEETPAEHLRNAMCLIGALKREFRTGGDVGNAPEFVAGIERRVWRAIEQLEGRVA